MGRLKLVEVQNISLLKDNNVRLRYFNGIEVCLKLTEEQDIPLLKDNLDLLAESAISVLSGSRCLS